MLRQQSDREAAESLLWDMQVRMGWDMDILIQGLKQWQDVDQDEGGVYT